MRLTNLEPRFLRYEERMDDDGKVHVYYVAAKDLHDAQGVMFLCPLCYTKNAGKIGTHSVIVWFQGRNVPNQAEPGAARSDRPAQRWTVEGTDFVNLTTKPSIALEGGCAWHGWITNGEAA